MQMGKGRFKEVKERADSLTVAIFDFDKYGQHDDLGHVDFAISALEHGQVTEEWFTLCSSDPHFPNRPCGKVKLSIETTQTWCQPEAVFEWRAHEDSIQSISVINSEGMSHLKGLVVSVGLDNAVRLWSSNGGLVGKIGHSTWDLYGILDALRKVRHEMEVHVFDDVAKNEKEVWLFFP